MRAILWLPVAVLSLTGIDLPNVGPLPEKKPLNESSGATDRPAPYPTPALAPPSVQATPRKQGQGVKDPPHGQAAKPGQKQIITAPQIDTSALSECERGLRELGVAFQQVGPVEGEYGCGVRRPYAVSEIADGVVLKPATQLRCATVLSMARWVNSVVLPAVAALPGDIRLTGLNHGSTYICRRRNNATTGKMSEHAIGNAVDVVGFEFEGRDSITVSPRAGEGTVEEAFQRAVRGGACLHFTTVLGPGADASHADHLHLDIAKRNGGYRLCQ
jgi:hypothetical protein